MAFTINGEEIYPSSLTNDPHILTVTIDGIPYHIRKSAIQLSPNPNVAKRIRLRNPEGNLIDMSPELEAKIFEAIADARNNKAVLPEVTVSAPDRKDMVGRYNIASNDAITVASGRPVNMHLRKAFDEGAKAQAAWAKEHPWLETAGLIAGAAPLAVAAYPALAGTGELAYPVLTNPYVDAALTSAAAGHGLNHTINEGINGWGDAAMTALELTPLGRVARPMWNAGKEGLQYTAKIVDNAASMTPEQTALASLNSDINPKLPMAVKALKANKQAVQDVAEMNKYHAANVAEYNKATGSNSTSIPFRTDITGSQIKVLPDEEFNAAMRGKKTNSPNGNVENIGGLYSGIDDTTYLRAKGNPSTAYHEFLHRHRYGTTNPEVTRWRIDQLVDPERIKNFSPQLKQYYLSEMEFPVHLRQQGESMGIKVGQEFPGEEAFNELLFNSGRSGAATYAKGMDLDSPIEDKKLVWKALNGTLFGQAIPIIGSGAAGTLYKNLK